MSPRISADQLARIGRRLSQRDGQVLQLAYELRVLASRHVEGLVMREGSALTRARRSRALLARLSEVGVLARLARRIGGVRAGSSGYLYRIAPAGRRLLGLPTRSGWREPGMEFVEHTLAAADLHLGLALAGQRGEIEGFEVEHEPACWRRFPGPDGVGQWLKPDLFAVVRTADYELLWFVEIDRGTESLTRVVTKAQQYLAYWRAGHEQHRHGVFPRVAWVAPNERRATAIWQALARAGQPAQALSIITTEAEAVAALSRADHAPPLGGTT